jgi:hypothetical protein
MTHLQEAKSMVLVTMNEPYAGMIINDGYQRVRVVRVRRWTGTVADLEVVDV